MRVNVHSWTTLDVSIGEFLDGLDRVIRAVDKERRGLLRLTQVDGTLSLWYDAPVEPKHKRFILFTGPWTDIIGGYDDTSRQYDEAGDAIADARPLLGDERWVSVVDTTTARVIWNSRECD